MKEVLKYIMFAIRYNLPGVTDIPKCKEWDRQLNEIINSLPKLVENKTILYGSCIEVSAYDIPRTGVLIAIYDKDPDNEHFYTDICNKRRPLTKTAYELHKIFIEGSSRNEVYDRVESVIKNFRGK